MRVVRKQRPIRQQAGPGYCVFCDYNMQGILVGSCTSASSNSSWGHMFARPSAAQAAMTTPLLHYFRLQSLNKLDITWSSKLQLNRRTGAFASGEAPNIFPKLPPSSILIYLSATTTMALEAREDKETFFRDSYALDHLTDDDEVTTRNHEVPPRSIRPNARSARGSHTRLDSRVT
jgi:hypothetical protein